MVNDIFLREQKQNGLVESVVLDQFLELSQGSKIIIIITLCIQQFSCLK